MLEGKSIAVVVPAYNEATLIKKTILSIPDYVDFICVVDDASSDNTVAQANAIVTAKNNITVTSHTNNQGVGAAIVTGYRECLHRKHDVVAVMAGDAQMDPADLLILLSPIVRNEADYCKGDRLSWKGVSKIMPFLRYWGNHGLSLLTKLTSGYSEVRDSQCGYTAISAQALSRLKLSQVYTRYGFPNDILAHLFTIEARLAQVTVRPIYATEKSGISLFTAFVRVPLVLLRSWVYRRKIQRRKYRSLTSGSIGRA